MLPCSRLPGLMNLHQEKKCMLFLELSAEMTGFLVISFFSFIVTRVFGYPQVTKSAGFSRAFDCSRTMILHQMVFQWLTWATSPRPLTACVYVCVSLKVPLAFFMIRHLLEPMPFKSPKYVCVILKPSDGRIEVPFHRPTDANSMDGQSLPS